MVFIFGTRILMTALNGKTLKLGENNWRIPSLPQLRPNLEGNDSKEMREKREREKKKKEREREREKERERGGGRKKSFSPDKIKSYYLMVGRFVGSAICWYNFQVDAIHTRRRL
jgi:hypothetical protein